LDTSVAATVFGREDEAARTARLANPGVDFYTVKGELDTLIAERTELIREGTRRILREEAAASGGSSGSPNGRGRGVVVDIRDAKAAAAAKVNAGAGSSAISAVTAADEQRARELLDLQREMADAQSSLRVVTEDLRAELGGPFAQVQLEYIRREDELISLAKLAGLSTTELAESLGLLEAARLRDVDAIQAQIDADKEYQQALADGPLIDRMDSLRDTTAGFFADLVKNGESAIDRLQDYLLNNALESIGKQIAEGLFGGFGTTGEGSKGSGFAALFGSLFGGGRAIGGPVSAGRLYPVGEKGMPELLTVKGRQFLIPGSDGNVTPAAAAGGGQLAPIYQTINVAGSVTRQSAYQLSLESARKLSAAQSRG
jgi:hypothetical protein